MHRKNSQKRELKADYLMPVNASEDSPTTKFLELKDPQLHCVGLAAGLAKSEQPLCRKPARHNVQDDLESIFGIVVARQTGMITEQICPYCKRVHYSIYTAERCAARHDVSSELTDL
jgi:hypothetical protein